MKQYVLMALIAIAPVQALSDLELFEAMGVTDQEITRIGLIPQIIEKIGVLNKGLSQSDVVDGQIILDSVGSYVPLTNLVADIVITGTNVTLNLDGRSVIGTLDISGSIVVIKNGAFYAPTPLNVDSANTPAVFVAPGANSVLLKHFHVECADSQLTGTLFELVPTDTTLSEYELVGTGTVFDAVSGRDGIAVCGKVVSLFDCSISSGSAAHSDESNAADGGHAIMIGDIANKVRVKECTIITGNGGNSNSGAGGNGGNGIFVKDTANHIEVDSCTVFETGVGGDGITGGDGGHGISIESSAVDVGVHGCRIRNTGAGGSPGGGGGKAVLDMVTTAGAQSIIFGNFAHNIANPLKFDLRGLGIEQGIKSPNPPDGTVLNSYANVFVS